MIQIFDQPPAGLQNAPHDPRLLAVGYRVSMRQIDFGQVHDQDGLMLAALSGLGLSQNFGRTWEALRDVLTDPAQRPERFALLLTDYANFRRRRPKLAAQLESVLLEAQAQAALAGRSLWLLSEEPDHDPYAR